MAHEDGQSPGAQAEAGDEELRHDTATRTSIKPTRHTNARRLRLRQAEWRARAPQFVMVFAGWALTLWISTLFHLPDLRLLALIAHLGLLVVGLGAAVMIEYSGLLWVLGRGSLYEVRETEKRLSPLSWVGFIGMLLSGMFLAPNVADPLTAIKLFAVLVVGLNAVNSKTLVRALKPLRKRLTFQDAPQHIRVWCVASGAVSQLGWWTAVFVGALNTAGRG